MEPLPPGSNEETVPPPTSDDADVSMRTEVSNRSCTETIYKRPRFDSEIEKKCEDVEEPDASEKAVTIGEEDDWDELGRGATPSPNVSPNQSPIESSTDSGVPSVQLFNDGSSYESFISADMLAAVGACEESDSSRQDTVSYSSEDMNNSHAIEKFSFDANSLLTEEQQLFSPKFYIRGLQWKILIKLIKIKNLSRVGMFLQCAREGSGWNCSARAYLTVHNAETSKDRRKFIQHVFHERENDWGFKDIISLDELLNVSNGYVDENGQATVGVEVIADPPKGVGWDSRVDCGCIGLKNQGATCYMNSLLQALFHTNQLRKTVYSIPTTNEDDGTVVGLQRLFFLMENSAKALCTKKLTKAFGWDQGQVSLQQDLQEMCRVLLDTLERSMKDTSVEGTIPSLFKLVMEQTINCTEVVYSSSKKEEMYDMQLHIVSESVLGRCCTLNDSLDEFFKEETLEGDNAYSAGDYGKQSAIKGGKILFLPPVLHLHLSRFVYDPEIDHFKKLNERLEFPDELDMGKFMKEPNEDCKYVLHAVLVHSGDLGCGHYVVFINMNINGQSTHDWVKFDDDVVGRVTQREAVLGNYGGSDKEDMYIERTTNAYMLVYIKKSMADTVLCPISQADIPGHLVERFEEEKRNEILMPIRWTTQEIVSLEREEPYDLYDDENASLLFTSLSISSEETIRSLAEILAKPNPIDSIRIWRFDQVVETCPSRKRTGTLLWPVKKEDMTLGEAVEYKRRMSPHIYPLTLFVEHNSDGKQLPHFNSSTDVMVHLKYFDTCGPESHLLYKGCMSCPREELLPKLKEWAMQMRSNVSEEHRCRLSSQDLFRFYIEMSPNMVIPFGSSALPIALYSQQGEIIIMELPRDDLYEDIEYFFDTTHKAVQIEVHEMSELCQLNPSARNDWFPLTVQLDWPVSRLIDLISEEWKWPSDNLLLWGVQFTPHATHDKPLSSYDDMLISHLLFSKIRYDPRHKLGLKVWLNRLHFHCSDIFTGVRLVIEFRFLKSLHDVYTVKYLVPKVGIVADVLNELSNIFPYNEEGTHILRLVRMSGCEDFYHVDSIIEESEDLMYGELFGNDEMFRVEEVPEDQYQASLHFVPFDPKERLLTAVLFDVLPYSEPIIILLRNGELVSEVRKRIMKALELPEGELEKAPLAILRDGQVEMWLEEEGKEEEEAVIDFMKMGRQMIESQTLFVKLSIGVKVMKKRTIVKVNVQSPQLSIRQ